MIYTCVNILLKYLFRQKHNYLFYFIYILIHFHFVSYIFENFLEYSNIFYLKKNILNTEIKK